MKAKAVSKSAQGPKPSNQPFFNHTKKGSFLSPGQEQQPFFSPQTIQPKLTIGEANDPFEREADAVADQVVGRAGNTPAVQAKCEACEQEEAGLQKAPSIQKMSTPKASQEEEAVQAKAEGASNTASPAMSQQLQQMKGQGAPLPEKTNQSMSQAFGQNFSQVRIHTNDNAVQMNRDLNAKAFTHGSDIYFNQGQYAPESNQGKHLLAHELTHVVQQGSQSSSIQRTCENDPATAPASGMSGCSTETSRASNPNETVTFGSGSMGLSSAAKTALSSLAAKWHADGRNDTVRIDGFASCDGGTTSNWKLSCNRTKTVEAELKTPSDGSTGIDPSATFAKFAHGETEEFSSSNQQANRAATATLQPTPEGLPSAMPAAGANDFEIRRVGNSNEDRLFFDLGSAVPSRDVINAINDIKRNAPASVSLIGFTSMDEPDTLAQDRADAVEALLTSGPNAVAVSSATGNPAATSTQSNFTRARSVEVVVAGNTPSTLDCTATDVAGNLLHPPTDDCSTMDPQTLADFNAAKPVADDAMTEAMHAIDPSHSDFNPTLVQRFFGNNDPATLTQLNTNMGNLQTHVSNLDPSTSNTQCGGQCDIGGCDGGTIAYNNGVDAASVLTLCVPFFKELNLNDQARNLIHESAHGTTPLGGAPTEGTDDVAYRHERMIFQLSPEDRLRNSDSYALFALFAKEIKTTGLPNAEPAGILTPANDTINGITGNDQTALELALAHLEKRLAWCTSHIGQLFGEAQSVKDGSQTWSATWAEDYMQEMANRFPVTAPPGIPTSDDMIRLAAINERYIIMEAAVKRDLTISSMPSGVVSWATGSVVPADNFSVGPDFFRATPEHQISLLLQTLAQAVPNIETAFIPGYVTMAKFVHDNA